MQASFLSATLPALPDRAASTTPAGRSPVARPSRSLPVPTLTATPAPAVAPLSLNPARPATPRLLITLATYNEADNLALLVAEIRKYAPDADILVIDDNSPDGTGKLAERLRESDPTIAVLHRPGKLGLGTATLAAMRYAMDHDYDLMQNMDADFSHPPRFLPAILKGMETHDIMIGSRYAPGGATENWPLTRLVVSRCVNTLVRFFFRMPIRDASGAFRCYRVSMLRNAHLERTQSRGYSFQQEVLFRCHLVGAHLGESPIIFENRRAGKSKVSVKEAVRSIATILWLGVTHFFGVEDYRR